MLVDTSFDTLILEGGMLIRYFMLYLYEVRHYCLWGESICFCNNKKLILFIIKSLFLTDNQCRQ